MTASGFARRSVAVLASAGATAALTLIPSVGAHAAVQGTYEASADAEAVYHGPTSGGSCQLTSAPGSEEPTSSPVDFSHGTKHRSVDLDASFASSDNASDTVRIQGHADSTLTLKRKHNDLSTFDLRVGGSIKVTHSVAPSACTAEASVLAGAEVLFTEHKKGWFTLTRDTKKPNSADEFALVNFKTGATVTLDFYEGSASHQVSRAKVKPGTYLIAEGQAGVTAGPAPIFLKSQQRSSKVAQTVHLHGAFTPLKKHHH